MTDENLMNSEKVDFLYDPSQSEQLMELEDRVDRLLKLSESLAATCRDLSALTRMALEPMIGSTPDSDVQYTGGTPHEIIHAMLEALKFNGIEKVEGRGWEVRVGLQVPREFRLLRDAIGYRIECAALATQLESANSGETPSQLQLCTRKFLALRGAVLSMVSAFEGETADGEAFATAYKHLVRVAQAPSDFLGEGPQREADAVPEVCKSWHEATGETCRRREGHYGPHRSRACNGTCDPCECVVWGSAAPRDDARAPIAPDDAPADELIEEEDRWLARQITKALSPQREVSGE